MIWCGLFVFFKPVRFLADVTCALVYLDGISKLSDYGYLPNTTNLLHTTTEVTHSVIFAGACGYHFTF